MAFPKLAAGWETNVEGAPPKVPVPYDRLGYESPEDLKVFFTHRWFSPPSSTIRSILNYYGVQQERLIMDMPFKKSIKASSYKKVPSVIFLPSDGSGGYQVNDTRFILRALYSAITGREVSKDLPEEDETQIVNTLISSVFVALALEHKKASSMSRHLFGADAKAIFPLKTFSVHVVKKVSRRFVREGVPPFKDMMAWFVERIQSRKEGAKFFSHSGDEPSPIDLLVYGIVSYAIVITEDKIKNGPLKGECWVHEDLKAAGAMDWFNAVDEAYNQRAKEPLFPDEAKDDAARSLLGCS